MNYPDPAYRTLPGGGMAKTWEKKFGRELATKQDILVSGENIKTVNGVSILGEGDLPISVQQLTEVTYNDLHTLRDEGNLVPGTLYRITDYHCTTTQGDTRGADHQFDIVLLALSNNKLAEEGWAMMHDNTYDVTFYDGVIKKCYLYLIGGDYNVIDCETFLGISAVLIGEIEVNEETKTAITSVYNSTNLTEENLPYNYFQNSKLEAWKVWYCLDNDVNKYAWASTQLQLVDVESTFGHGAPVVRQPSFDVVAGSSWYNTGYIYAWGTSADLEDGDPYNFIYSKTEVVNPGDEVHHFGRNEDNVTNKGSVSGTGVVYRLIDEFNNDCPYDFKNIQFLRYVVDGVDDNIVYNNTVEDILEHFDGKCVGIKGGFYDENDDTVSAIPYGCTIDTSAYYKWMYTFSISIDNGNTYIDQTIDIVNRTVNPEDNDDSDAYSIRDNTIKPSKYNFIPELLGGDGYWNKQNAYYLNNICFVSVFTSALYSDSIIGNKFDNDCYYSTFGAGCCYNIFGNNCGLNTWGIRCKSNILGDGCTYNVVAEHTFTNNVCGRDFVHNFSERMIQDNIFGDGCYNNIFKSNFWDNILGISCSSNEFDQSVAGNTLGNNFINNKVGGSFAYNTFGNECRSNKFGIEFKSNTFMNACSYNTFGDFCSNNKFGNRCLNITFGSKSGNTVTTKNYIRYCSFENGVQYTNFTTSATTSSSNYLQNVMVGLGVSGTSSTRKTITHPTVNDAFQTTYLPTGSTTVNV